MKVNLCQMCNTLYIEGRPFVCSNCNSNVGIKEYDSSREEIDMIKEDCNVKVFEKGEYKDM